MFQDELQATYVNRIISKIAWIDYYLGLNENILNK